jgi:hypothetical protein
LSKNSLPKYLETRKLFFTTPRPKKINSSKTQQTVHKTDELVCKKNIYCHIKQLTTGFVMMEFKQMNFNQKLTSILSFTDIVEQFAPYVVHSELGEEKLSELRNIWKQGTQPIPAEAPDNEKYEVAYRNLMYKWVSANDLMRSNKGEEGTAIYMKAAISGWKKKYSRSSPMFKIIGALSRKRAFKLLSNRLAYELQVFSPYTVTERNEKRMVLDVSPCKIIKDQNGPDFCVMACQNIIPSWLQKQYNLKMSPNRQGENCIVTFEPFS